MLNNNEYAFIGEKQCGCIVAMHLDNNDRNTRDAVEDMNNDALCIRRVPVEQARFSKCAKHQPENTQHPIAQADPCNCCHSRRAMDYLPLTSSHQLECKQCGRIAHGATIDELLAHWREANQC